mmetsp:Transcript_80103/g.171536  ORF Transcript_80103/g.171536 Transcript_80103/m.171536 type:complete len:273 (-) Transcript_80103:294-1112(-)
MEVRDARRQRRLRGTLTEDEDARTVSEELPQDVHRDAFGTQCEVLFGAEARSDQHLHNRVVLAEGLEGLHLRIGGLLQLRELVLHGVLPSDLLALRRLCALTRPTYHTLEDVLGRLKENPQAYGGAIGQHPATALYLQPRLRFILLPVRRPYYDGPLLDDFLHLRLRAWLRTLGHLLVHHDELPTGPHLVGLGALWLLRLLLLKSSIVLLLAARKILEGVERCLRHQGVDVRLGGRLGRLGRLAASEHGSRQLLQQHAEADGLPINEHPDAL